MANDFFDAADYTAPVDNTLARASTVTAIAQAVEAGFDKLPTEANVKQGKITYAVDTGAANAYVVALPHAPAAYVDGLEANVKISVTNTGASTLNVNGLGVVAWKRYDGTAMQANDLLAGAVVPARHNGTNFRMIGPPGSDAANAAASAAAAATSETNAATSETNAASSASAASSSASAASTSASNASTSETNAATSETNAATSATNAVVNAAGFRFNFDNATSMADPGTGDIRFNNATVSSVTALALDATSADTGNPDVSDYIATWDDSTATIAGTLVIRKIGTPATFAIFNVTGAVVDNTGWLQVAVTYVACCFYAHHIWNFIYKLFFKSGKRTGSYLHRWQYWY